MRFFRVESERRRHKHLRRTRKEKSRRLNSSGALQSIAMSIQTVSGGFLPGKRLAFCICCVVAAPLFAREGTSPLSRQRAVQPLATVKQLVSPPTDVQAALVADATAGGGTPRRSAVAG